MPRSSLWHTRCHASGPSSGPRVRARSEVRTGLVGDPAGPVAALLGNVRKHAVPSAFLDLVIVDDGSAALDEPQLAGGGRNELRRTLGHKAAVGTRLATNAQRAALRALDQLALVA